MEKKEIINKHSVQYFFGTETAINLLNRVKI